MSSTAHGYGLGFPAGDTRAAGFPSSFPNPDTLISDDCIKPGRLNARVAPKRRKSK